MRKLEELTFDNSYARLPADFYSRLAPTPFSTPPYLVSFNAAAAALIDLSDLGSGLAIAHRAR